MKAEVEVLNLISVVDQWREWFDSHLFETKLFHKIYI